MQQSLSLSSLPALSSVPRPGYFLPLVVPLVFVLLAVSLLVFYQCKRKRNFEENSEEDADYVNMEVTFFNLFCLCAVQSLLHDV